MVRNHFFTGRLLTATDFQTEQDYFLDKHRRHNRKLHGAGIVEGLKVTVTGGASAQGASITVAPGFAITPSGDEVCVAKAVSCKIKASPPCFVALHYVDRLIDAMPSPTGGSPQDALHVEESFEVKLETALPPSALALARLRRNHGRWSIDRAFRAPLLRRGA